MNKKIDKNQCSKIWKHILENDLKRGNDNNMEKIRRHFSLHYSERRLILGE